MVGGFFSYHSAVLLSSVQPLLLHELVYDEMSPAGRDT